MGENENVWKSGMDSTLIFVSCCDHSLFEKAHGPKVGLFVSIISSFLVPVSQNLSQNPADLTNEILSNLTSIVYEIALLNGLEVPAKLPQPKPFKPAHPDEVVTFFWYSALIISVRPSYLPLISTISHLSLDHCSDSFCFRSTMGQSLFAAPGGPFTYRQGNAYQSA